MDDKKNEIDALTEKYNKLTKERKATELTQKISLEMDWYPPPGQPVEWDAIIIEMGLNRSKKDFESNPYLTLEEIERLKEILIRKGYQPKGKVINLVPPTRGGKE